ncbi:MAG: FAD-dependent oxidoreductase, partial [Acetobacteraceae bacterium]
MTAGKTLGMPLGMPLGVPVGLSRRRILAGALALPFLSRTGQAQATARVVIVGGGFGGASAARALRHLAPNMAVTLIEANETFTACPFSNGVIAGLRDIRDQRFGYATLAAEGIQVIHQPATTIDPVARRVSLGDASAVGYDRLILSPGIDIAWGAPPGYDE